MRQQHEAKRAGFDEGKASGQAYTKEEKEMKLLSIALITGAVILGMSEGDCTAAVILAMLLLPGCFERKVVKSNAGKNQR